MEEAKTKLQESWDEFFQKIDYFFGMSNASGNIFQSLFLLDKIIKSDEINNFQKTDANQIWSSLYKQILDPCVFFEIDQCIYIFENVKKNLENAEMNNNDKIDFNVFIEILKGYRNSWKEHLPAVKLSMPIHVLSLYTGKMIELFSKLYTQKKIPTQKIHGVEYALFSLNSTLFNFPQYEKVLDSANKFNSFISIFKNIDLS